MDRYGLIGYPLGYSFSKKHFSEKFAKEHINATYSEFIIKDISEIKGLFGEKDIKGANVTIPHKESVIPFLDELDEVSQQIGAVNTICFLPNGTKKGYNTDYWGFEESIKPLLQKYHTKALILGTGGASKAIKYVFDKMGIDYISASTKQGLTINELPYTEITDTITKERKIIVNCTPLGTYPKVDSCPSIPYEAITNQHILYDLVYNPATTLFMQKGLAQGGTVKNGHEMLVLQAEKSWEIWNNKAK